MIEMEIRCEFSKTGVNVSPYLRDTRPRNKSGFGTSKGSRDRSLGLMIGLSNCEVGIEIVEVAHCRRAARRTH